MPGSAQRQNEFQTAASAPARARRRPLSAASSPLGRLLLLLPPLFPVRAALTRPCPPSFPRPLLPPLPAGPCGAQSTRGRPAAPARGGPGSEGSGLGAGPGGQCRPLPLSAPALAAGCALLPACPALPRRLRFAFTLLFLIIIIF